MRLWGNSEAPIFVPEVDWCSTNINQKSKSIENRISFNPGKTNKSDISQLLIFIQYLRKIIIQMKTDSWKRVFFETLKTKRSQGLNF